MLALSAEMSLLRWFMLRDAPVVMLCYNRSIPNLIRRTSHYAAFVWPTLDVFGEAHTSPNPCISSWSRGKDVL